MENHGKVKYSNRSSNCLPFDRKVESKKDKIKRIEMITKRAKVPKEGLVAKCKDRQIAKENAEMLFNLIHGNDRMNKSVAPRSKPLSSQTSPRHQQHF